MYANKQYLKNPFLASKSFFPDIVYRKFSYSFNYVLGTCKSKHHIHGHRDFNYDVASTKLSQLNFRQFLLSMFKSHAHTISNVQTRGKNC